MTDINIAPAVEAAEAVAIPVVDEEVTAPKRKRRTKAEMIEFRAQQAAEKAEKDRLKAEAEALKAMMTITDPILAQSLPIGTPVIVTHAYYGHGADGKYAGKGKRGTITGLHKERPEDIANGHTPLGIEVTADYDIIRWTYRIEIERNEKTEAFFTGLEEQYSKLLHREQALWKGLHTAAVKNSWCPEYEAWAKTVEGGEMWLRSSEKWDAEIKVTMPYGERVYNLNDHLQRGIVMANKEIVVTGRLHPNSEDRTVPEIDEKDVDIDGQKTVEAALESVRKRVGDKMTVEVIKFKQTKAIKEFDTGTIFEKVAKATARWEAVWISLATKATDGDGYGSMGGVRTLFKQLADAGYDMPDMAIVECTVHQMAKNTDGVKKNDGTPFFKPFANHGRLPDAVRPTIAQRIAVVMHHKRVDDPTEAQIKDFLSTKGLTEITRIETHKVHRFGTRADAKAPKGYKFTGRKWTKWSDAPDGVTVLLRMNDDEYAIYDGAIGTWHGSYARGGHMTIVNRVRPQREQISSWGNDYVWLEIEENTEVVGERGVGKFTPGTKVEVYNIDGMEFDDGPKHGVILRETGGWGGIAVGFDDLPEWNNEAGNTGIREHPHAWYVNKEAMAEITDAKKAEPVKVKTGEWTVDPARVPVRWQDIGNGQTVPIHVLATEYQSNPNHEGHHLTWHGHPERGGHFTCTECGTTHLGANRDDRFHLMIEAPVVTFSPTLNPPPAGTFITITKYEHNPEYIGKVGWFGTAGGGKHPNDHPVLWTQRVGGGGEAVWLATWEGEQIEGTEDMKNMVREHINDAAIF